MRGVSESASKNTLEPIFKHPKYSNIRISENSLASDLVFVSPESLNRYFMASVEDYNYKGPLEEEAVSVGLSSSSQENM